MNLPKFIAWLTSVLFLLVAIASFALSYNALRAIATANGIPDNWLGDIWPLLVDFSLIVFSLAVVTAHLYSESTRKQWMLVTIYTITTVMFNMLHAPDNLLARVIAAIPPVSLFFSFELLMEQLKNSVQRNHKVEVLTQQVTDLQQAIDDPILVRRQQVKQMLESHTQKAIAGELGVSISTVRNDIKVLNGHN